MKTIKLLQTTAFKVNDIRTFSNLPSVKLAHKAMSESELPINTFHDYFSFSFTPASLGKSEFDKGVAFEIDDIRLLLSDIENHIAENHTCHINYVNHNVGDELTFYSLEITPKETTGFHSQCNGKNTFGSQDRGLILSLCPVKVANALTLLPLT